MQDRHADLIALGPALFEEAKQAANGSVNEAYLLVHRLMAKAFKEDLSSVSKDSLKTHLVQQLKNGLQ